MTTETQRDDAESPDRLDDEVAYRLLANRDRRAIIRALHELVADATEPHPEVHRDTVVAHLQADYGMAHSQAMVLLHHHHLPELEAAGMVVYDGSGGEITVTEPGTLHGLVELYADVEDLL